MLSCRRYESSDRQAPFHEQQQPPSTPFLTHTQHLTLFLLALSLSLSSKHSTLRRRGGEAVRRTPPAIFVEKAHSHHATCELLQSHVDNFYTSPTGILRCDWRCGKAGHVWSTYEKLVGHNWNGGAAARIA